MQGFYRNTVDLIESIEQCLKLRRILPCLTLLYSGIDVISSLERKDSERTRDSFTRWVDKYLLNAYPLGCTALELYSARCGVVHTFSPDSDLSRAKKARRVLYAWGDALANNLQDTATRLGYHDIVAIHIRDLVDSFRSGLADYWEDVQSDSQRLNKLKSQAGLWFSNMDKRTVSEFLERTNDSEAT